MNKDWETKTLGEVIKLEYGKPLAVEDRDPEGLHPAYGANGVKTRTDKFYCDKPSIIVGRKGSAGELTLTEEKFWPLDVTYFVTFDENKYDLQYIFQLLKGLDLPQYATGVKPGINRNLVYAIEVSMPDLSEQKRIVKILNEKFVVIDELIKITEQQIVDVKELFESRLNEIFENELDEEKTFEDVCVLQRGFDLPTRLRKKGDYPLMSANGTTDYINQYKVDGPGVVTGRSGSIGFVHYIEDNFWPLNTALYIKDFKGNEKKFIFYFLKCFDLSRFSSGAGVPTLNRNHVHSEMVRTTSDTKKQKEVVKELDGLFVNKKELEVIFRRKITDLEELKKSYLQDAFAGKL